MPLIFTVEDMKTPEKLERVFQQLRTELGNLQSGVSTATSLSTKPTDINKLAAQLGPLLRSQLQATGATPLNTGILLPSTVTSLVAGTGISISSGTGDITITNTGVTSIVAGTGISISGATGAVTVTNGGVTSAIGTTDQVNVSAATGAVTFSLPQSIATTSTPQFARMGLGQAADTVCALDANGIIRSSGSGSPTAGVGAETLWTGTTAIFQGYNRATSAYQPVQLVGTSLLISAQSSTVTIQANAVSTIVCTNGAVKFPTGYGAGPILSDASGNLTSGATTTAPSTSVGVAIVDYYGSSATNFLGTPNAWLGMTIGGTAYKLALYT